MNRVQLLHLQNRRQSFLCCSEAYMWQCHSQCISSCTQAGWCNPDPWLRLTIHGISTAHIHWHASSNWCCQHPIVSSLPLNASIKALSAAPACGWRTPVDFSLCRTCWAKLEWEEGPRECCFHQLGFPTHCSFIHDQHTTDPWPWPLTSLWVRLCFCEPRGTPNNVRINYKWLSKHQNQN